jgi:hypothetical protein
MSIAGVKNTFFSDTRNYIIATNKKNTLFIYQPDANLYGANYHGVNE